MEKKQYARLAAVWVVPALIVAVVLGGFSIYEVCAKKPRITLMYMAKQYERDNRTLKAANAYYNLFTYGYDSKQQVRRAIILNHKAGNMEEVVNMVNKKYKEEVQADAQIAPLYEEAQVYLKTQQAMAQTVEEVTDEKTLEQALNELHDMHGNSAYDDGLLSFYEYYLASQHGLDIKACSGYINAALEAKPHYTWLLSYQAQCQRMLNQLDEAQKTARQAIGFDEDDFEAWHQLSIVYLLKNDVGNAVKAGERSFEIEPMVENCNDLALCYVIARNEEKYREIVAFMQKKGETPSQKIQLYRDGKTTLQDLFLMPEVEA